MAGFNPTLRVESRRRNVLYLFFLFQCAGLQFQSFGKVGGICERNLYCLLRVRSGVEFMVLREKGEERLILGDLLADISEVLCFYVRDLHFS